MSWSGEVVLDDDVVVPEGDTLRLEPDCLVRSRVRSAARQFAFETLAFGRYGVATTPDLRRIVVFGALEAAGTAEQPVTLERAGFGGVLLLGRGRARLRSVRLASQAGAAVTAADFARAELFDCSLKGGEGALACGGFARATLRRCRFEGCSGSAVVADDDAAVTLSRCVLAGCRVGVETRGHAAALLGSCELSEGKEAGATASGAATVRSARGRWTAQPEGLSARQGGLVVSRADAFERNVFGVKACGGSRAKLSDARFSGHEKAGLLVEEGAAAEAARCAFDGDENGALVHGGGRLDADGCTFARCRDTAVWRVPDGRAKLTGTVFRENARDVN